MLILQEVEAAAWSRHGHHVLPRWHSSPAIVHVRRFLSSPNCILSAGLDGLLDLSLGNSILIQAHALKLLKQFSSVSNGCLRCLGIMQHALSNMGIDQRQRPAVKRVREFRDGSMFFLWYAQEAQELSLRPTSLERISRKSESIVTAFQESQLWFCRIALALRAHRDNMIHIYIYIYVIIYVYTCIHICALQFTSTARLAQPLQQHISRSFQCSALCVAARLQQLPMSSSLSAR